MDEVESRLRNEEIDPVQSPPGIVYVKRVCKTDHAIMFELSNNLVQIYFIKDGSEILLNFSGRWSVTYVDKKGDQSNMFFSKALKHDDFEIVLRLTYIKKFFAAIVLEDRSREVVRPAD